MKHEIYKNKHNGFYYERRDCPIHILLNPIHSSLPSLFITKAMLDQDYEKQTDIIVGDIWSENATGDQYKITRFDPNPNDQWSVSLERVYDSDESHYSIDRFYDDFNPVTQPKLSGPYYTAPATGTYNVTYGGQSQTVELPEGHKYYEDNGYLKSDTNQCQHEWAQYTGLIETFEYCTKCDERRS